jgi:hypothetical protein
MHEYVFSVFIHMIVQLSLSITTHYGRTHPAIKCQLDISQFFIKMYD